MTDQLWHLLKEIENKKEELLESFQEKNTLNSGPVLLKSRELDDLIVKYQQLKINRLDQITSKAKSIK
jgi:hypothetical protein